MQYVAFHDLLAGLAALVLLTAVIALAVIGREIPPLLEGGFGVAIGYVFRGGVQVTNELRHRKPTPDP